MAGRRQTPWRPWIAAAIWLTACGGRTGVDLSIDGPLDEGSDGAGGQGTDDHSAGGSTGGGLGESGGQNAGGQNTGGQGAGGQNTGGQGTGGEGNGGQNTGGQNTGGQGAGGQNTGGQGAGGLGGCEYGFIDEGNGCQPFLVDLWPTAGLLASPVSPPVREYVVHVPLWTEGLLLVPSVASGADVAFNGQELAGGYGLRAPGLIPGAPLQQQLEVFKYGHPSTFYQLHLQRDGRFAYIKASNTTSGVGFGVLALSADGRTLAVGAPHEASGAGAVYVFVRDGDSWMQEAYLEASNAQPFDEFGISVALSNDGNVLLVGALAEDSAATGVDGDSANNSASSAGAAYVLTRSGGIWQEEAYLKASNTEPGDYFGRSVAISADGSTLAIGAPEEDGASSGVDNSGSVNGASASGAVYVFSRGASIEQQAYIKASNTDALDAFGIALALSADGSTLAVGADCESSAATGLDGDQLDDTAPNAGAVYLLTRTGSTWSHETYIKASNTSADDAFGAAVALSSDASTLAIGAYGEGSKSTGINGNQSGSGFGAGAVYLLRRSGSSWTQQAYIKASNSSSGGFGWSTALSENGNVLLVGAVWEASGSIGIDGNQYLNGSWPQAGATYRFEHSDSNWSQAAFIKASNTSHADAFGYRVGLSADGTTVAASAPYEDGGATGINGDSSNDDQPDSGAVYVFSQE